jgi:hypothetical protein
MAVVVPPDDWDAWATWAPKAKVLLVGEGPMSDVQYFGHPGYPLLWPVTWAYSSWFTGGWEDQLSRGWGSIFLAMTAWQVGVIILRAGGSRVQSWITAALFLSTPFAPLVASWSYAEIPMIFFIVCAFGRLLNWNAGPNKQDALFAAMFAAGAAYTKDEGLMAGALMLCLMMLNNPKRNGTSILAYAGVFILVAAPWIIWSKLNIHATSHALAGLEFSSERLSYAIGRIAGASYEIGKIWRSPQKWSIILWSTLAATLGALIFSSWKIKRLCLYPLAYLGIMFILIIFHNDEVHWQTSTSWDRLTLQILPMLIMISMLAWRELAASSSNRIS